MLLCQVWELFSKIIAKYLISNIQKYFIKKLLICWWLIWRSVEGCSWRSHGPAEITWQVSFQKTMRMIWWFWWSNGGSGVLIVLVFWCSGQPPSPHWHWVTGAGWLRTKTTPCQEDTGSLGPTHSSTTTRHCNTALSLGIIRELETNNYDKRENFTFSYIPLFEDRSQLSGGGWAQFQPCHLDLVTLSFHSMISTLLVEKREN